MTQLRAAVVGLVVVAVACAPSPEPSPPAALDLPASTAARDGVAEVVSIAVPIASLPPDPAAIDRAIESALLFQLEYLVEPPEPPSNDAQVGARAIRALVDSPSSTQLVARVAVVLAAATDPLQRLWDPALTLAPEHTAAWSLPESGRANPNRVLIEAAYCDDNGLRAETAAYLCGPMRDDGGYQSAHAAWALSIAVDRACTVPLPDCADALATELLSAAALDGAPTTTLDADLLAERLLFGLRVGGDRQGWIPHVRDLLSAQAPDGSFGVSVAGERPYYRYHAAMAAAWALATWRDAP